jgi:hypothetical protein
VSSHDGLQSRRNRVAIYRIEVICRYRVVDINDAAKLGICQLLQISNSRIPTPERCDMRGEDINNGEALHRTAPAEAAGHRITVWATKMEGFPFVLTQ